jgi:hypothetical protein
MGMNKCKIKIKYIKFFIDLNKTSRKDINKQYIIYVPC